MLKHHNYSCVSHSLDAIEFALKNCSPDNLVRNAIVTEHPLSVRDLYGNTIDLGTFGHKSILVISIGKASERMLTGLYEKLGKEISKSILIVPKGYVSLSDSNETTDKLVISASHPIPNKYSELASKMVIERLRLLDDYELVLFLISGGASSLIVSPVSSLSLSDKVEVNKSLVSSGANIKEINVVRKHLSQIKGGNILRILKPRRKVLTLLLSDVVGDYLDTIGSGLTFYDNSTFMDAVEILEKYDIIKNNDIHIQKVYNYLKQAANGSMSETLKPFEFESFDVTNCVIGNNAKFCEYIIDYLKSLGYSVHFGGSDHEGTVSDFSFHVKRLVNDLASNSALVMGGEITNTIEKSKMGKGGRNQEAICRILKLIATSEIENFSIICIGTDGIDGNSQSAGGLLSPRSLKYVIRNDVNIDQYLNSNNTNELLRKMKSNIKTGYTGTNFNDVYILVKGQ